MNLVIKKQLAANTLGVGKGRITFVVERLAEVREAITKQDVRDLVKSGAIQVKQVKGRKTNVSRKNRRGVGKVKVKVNKRKQEYVIMTRKLRFYVSELKKQGKLTTEESTEIRKKIRNRVYKSKANLRLYIEGLRK
ncbi:MAG: hypothetical protein PF542_00455 [Nanoarchaeota archaeon]|jgi:large subunit ribosomal protein L19e|nr:hypothetical protein [Nanoarchaeota archaeon]